MHGKLAQLLLAMGLAVALLASACDGGDDNGDATPTPGEEATTVAEPTAVETEYPLTVTDMLGRSVTIEAAPMSAAALSPTTVELVYAVGATSLTRSSSVAYPEEATTATDIGSSYEPNLEQIAELAPDVIFADSVLQPQLADSLEALGIPVVYVGAENFDDVITAVGIVGEVLNLSGRAEAVVTDLEGALDHIMGILPEEGPKVLILNGAANNFYSAKPESYVGSLVDLLGGENVAAGAPDNAPFPGYTQLSEEEILTSAPDVVLAITAGPPGATITDELSSNPAWADLPAVQNNRVHEIDVEIYLQAPGPRAGEAIAELAGLLYPEITGN